MTIVYMRLYHDGRPHGPLFDTRLSALRAALAEGLAVRVRDGSTQLLENVEIREEHVND